MENGKSKHDENYEGYEALLKRSPHYWDWFCEITNALRRGQSHGSATTTLDIIRNKYPTDAREPDTFKCRNDFAPFFARDYNATYGGDFYITKYQPTRDKPATGRTPRPSDVHEDDYNPNTEY